MRANDAASHALGGGFSFNFNNSNTKKKGRQLRSDKFYVIDVINMMQNHQKYNQQHLQQLNKLYLKQT